MLKKTKKKIAATLASAVAFANMLTMQAYAAGDVSGAIQSTWNDAKSQIKSIVNNVVFPVLDLLYSFTGESPYSLGELALLVVGQMTATTSLFNLFFIILLGYCTIKVVFANIKRGGILLCQIAIGSLYLFSVPRGFTDGFYNWIKQVIATCMTAFLQTTILYLGLLTFMQHPLIGVGICLSANEVPRIAQMGCDGISSHHGGNSNPRTPRRQKRRDAPHLQPPCQQHGTA